VETAPDRYRHPARAGKRRFRCGLQGRKAALPQGRC
jgi:hypothetical protein